MSYNSAAPSSGLPSSMPQLPHTAAQQPAAGLLGLCHIAPRPCGSPTPPAGKEPLARHLLVDCLFVFGAAMIPGHPSNDVPPTAPPPGATVLSAVKVDIYSWVLTARVTCCFSGTAHKTQVPSSDQLLVHVSNILSADSILEQAVFVPAAHQKAEHPSTDKRRSAAAAAEREPRREAPQG